MSDLVRNCEVCGRRFRHPAKLPHPRNCGRVACRAQQTYGPDDWAGQRRMAAARVAAGVELNDLDRAAQQRGFA